MEKGLTAAIIVAIILTLIIIHCIMRSKHPVRSAFISLTPGLIALVCVNLSSSFTGVFIPVSPMNLSVSAVLGIPGVTALLLLQRIL